MTKKQRVAAVKPLPVGLDEGAGRPLVLLPGYATRPDIYEPTVRLLAQRCRVVLADIYAIRGPWRYADVLRSFTATLDELDLHEASFLGHSFGGGIELGFAVRHPERVVELIFSDTLAVSREWALAGEAVRRPLGLLGMATPRAATDFTLSWLTHPRQLIDAAWWGFTSGRSRDIHLIAEAGLPSHVLWANRDSLLNREDGQEFARELDASFTVVDAPGYVDHDWMYRHPQLFVDHLDRLGLTVLGHSPVLRD
jgi:pimeloyl-ACP methyl ester carboxylesterase